MNPKKKTTLRAIDLRTCYDIPHKLRTLAREIEAGKHGRVTDVAVTARMEKDGVMCQMDKNYGTGDADVYLAMLVRAAARLS